MAPSTGRDESRVAEFVEHFGALLTHSGLPPIASRVWVLLLAGSTAVIWKLGLRRLAVVGG